MTELVRITRELSDQLDRLRFSAPVVHVYNPLVYAREPHERYLTRYGCGTKEVVFVGMNPGPWGMAQTGVPFGEVSLVRDWLDVTGHVARPSDEHPKKRVDGFNCRRSEVSGRRLWEMIRAVFETPERFFSRFFVLNYCPLLFLNSHGANVTPERLSAAERTLLTAACDEALRRFVRLLQPGKIIGVGNFAAEQARVATEGMPVEVGKILHPSPANPTANRCWKEVVLRQLHEQGVSF